MNLDARTLLFSLILANALMALSMTVAAFHRSDGKQDGIRFWAAAMFLEIMTWGLVAGRGHILDVYSVIAANGFKATSHALILAAIHEFQQRRAPRWQYLAPVALSLVMAAVLQDDINGRFVWIGFIYAFQMVLIARALLSDRETRAGRAWKLLFAGVVMIVVVLALRAYVAMSGSVEFAQPQNTLTPRPIQIVTYIAAMSSILLGSVGFVLMVKERMEREIMQLAMTDSLTQVPNRRALMQYAERALARRNGLPVAFLMIDLDRFKNINDTYGHLKGDEVLRAVAGVLTGRLRRHDLLGRYGGEEFLVVAPDTGADVALAMAESLRELIASIRFATRHGELSVSASIGISICPANDTCKLNEILDEADVALYTAKQAGRNKVVCSGSDNVYATDGPVSQLF
jgi:diguanylate cyclase (GGDEF)-like protein